MTWSWLSSWPVALVGLVASVIGVAAFVWASVRWARGRIREWRWARFDRANPSPFSSAVTSFNMDEFKRAYGLIIPEGGASTPTS
jgi:hypothetical protein